MLTHDVFYNRERSGYDELISYYPGFWKEILEFRANNRFAGHTLDRAAEGMEQVILNQFFETCSESMVSRYESFLNLGNSHKSLEERRRFLKISWNGVQKISASKIAAAIREFYGGKAVVDVEFTDRFIFSIQKLDSNYDIDRKIDEYLLKVMPAHIEYTVIYEAPIKCILHAAGVMAFGELLEIRQVF